MLVLNWLNEIQTAPPAGYVWCVECEGSGDCAVTTCLGTGYQYEGDQCGVCKASGLCVACAGNGYVKA